jgi:hypothetical protein
MSGAFSCRLRALEMESFDLVLLHGAPLFLKFEVVAYGGLILIAIVPHLVCKGNMIVSYLDFRKSSEPARSP